jgi:hypothetical protein
MLSQYNCVYKFFERNNYMFRPLGLFQVDSKIITRGNCRVQLSVLLINDNGGNEFSFYIKLVGLYLCNFNMENCADYSRVISWSISLASSESAMWLGLECVAWSIRGWARGIVAVEQVIRVMCF